MNHPEFNFYAEACRSDLRHPQPLIRWWYGLAANSCRLILRDLMKPPENEGRVREGNFSFLKTNATFERAMEIARKNDRWIHLGLKRWHESSQDSVPGNVSEPGATIFVRFA